MTQPPAAYIEGYEKARALNPDLADAYVEHTLVGDPLADAAMESLAEFDREKSHRLINAGMQGDDAGMREAPDALKELFSALDGPSVVDFNPALADPGSRAFYKYSDMFFVALVLEAVITGFTTGVSKSFYTTGRTAGNLRRLRQNTRHMVEITLPGGMERHGDGWKLTVRIRLIHAQLRRMLLKSNAWDVSVDGLPLHMSHMALAATGFSAINLQSVRKLGVRLTEEESLGFMHIWHYVTWLLGVPEKLLVFFRTEADAVHLKEIGYLCEPRPGFESVSMAHAVVKCVPELVGIAEPAKQKKMTDTLFRTSRALLGNELADALEYPKQSTFGILALLRMQRRFQILNSKIMPGTLSHDFNNFVGMMQRSVYDDTGISYRMPDAVKDTESSQW